MRTTSRALAFASRWFDAATVERIFAPLVADWQREWQDSSGLRRWSVHLRALTAFGCALLLSSPRILREPTPSTVSRRIVTRIARFTLVVTALLMLPSVFEMGAVWPSLLFVIPSGLVLAFPFATIAAVDAIRREHDLPAHVARAAILKLTAVSVLFMIVFGGFVVPASNQSFRIAAYQQSLRAQGQAARAAILDSRRDIPAPGLRERNTYELLTNHGFDDGTRYLPDTVSRELHNRASIATLPMILMWLRWRMLDPQRRIWSHLPPTVIAIAAFLGYGLLRQSNVMGVWPPLVIMLVLLGCDSWWHTKQSAVA